MADAQTVDLHITSDAHTDTLVFRRSAEAHIKSDTVRLTVGVAALVGASDHDEAALTERIQTVLNNFIVATWSFHKIRRDPVAASSEQVTLTATARVPLRENYALQQRARAVITDTVELTSVSTDERPSNAEITKKQLDLRMSILKQIKDCDIPAIKDVGYGDWRLGHIEFTTSDPTANYGGKSMTAATYTNMVPASEGDLSLSGTHRVYVDATVVLKRSV